MKFQHIKDGDWTCEIWFEQLKNLERPSHDGYEVTVVRSDDGFRVVETELGNEETEVLAITNRISDAYDYVRKYLFYHSETGFYIV